MNELNIKLTERNNETVSYGYELFSNLVDTNMDQTINKAGALCYAFEEDEFISYDGDRLKIHLNDKLLIKKILVKLFSLAPGYISSEGSLNFESEKHPEQRISVADLIDSSDAQILSKADQILH